MINKAHVTFLAIGLLLCIPATHAMHAKKVSSTSTALTPPSTTSSSPYINPTHVTSKQPDSTKIPGLTLLATVMSVGSIIVCGPRFWNEFGQHCLGLPKETGIFIPLAAVATTALCEGGCDSCFKKDNKAKKAE